MRMHILTPEQMEFDASIGRLRNIEAKKRNLKHKYGLIEELGEDMHILGVRGEHAAAKEYGFLPWKPRINNFTEPDLGKHVQVKTTTKNSHTLMVRPGANPEHLFVLVLGEYAPVFYVVGCIMGSRAMQPIHWWDKPSNGKPPAWFVEHEFLVPA